jgi:hypothetical protein
VSSGTSAPPQGTGSGGNDHPQRGHLPLITAIAAGLYGGTRLANATCSPADRYRHRDSGSQPAIHGIRSGHREQRRRRYIDVAIGDATLSPS